VADPGRAPAADRPRRVEKPWGHEIWFGVTDRYAGKVIHVRAGQALSLQYHERKEETVYVLHGLLDLQLDDEQGTLRTRRLQPGSGAHIPSGRRHRMIAVEDTDLCEVSTPELDDVVRLDDRYGREGTSGP